MRRKTVLLSVFVLAVMVISLNAPSVSSQPVTGDAMHVDSKMVISGLGDLSGTGSAEITYTGNAASVLRLAIFHGFDRNGDQWMDVNETRDFMNGVSHYLVGKSYWGITVKSATNFTTKSKEYITSHTSGLVQSQWSSTNLVMFKIGFEGQGLGATKMVETAQGAYNAFGAAVFDCTGFRFNGTLVLKHRVTSLVIGSFTNPEIADGNITELRAPFGDVIWYSFEGPVSSAVTADDQIAYSSFSIMENQQISFAVLFIGCLMILRMPGKNFDKFAKLHPRKFRKYAKPLMSVRISAYILAAVLVVLYLFPFLFSFVSKSAMFYAAYLYLLVPVAIIGEYFFSKGMYNKAAISIPDESIIEVKQALIQPEEGEGEILCKVCYKPIEAGLEIFQCNCGFTMHVECAEKVQTCPSCGEMLFPQRTRSIQCRSCGETFLYSGREDPYSIQCAKCGAFQEEIKAGKNYLVVDEDPRNAFMMIRAMSLSERPTMCLTVQFPGKIRSEYDLANVQVKWLSDSSTDIDNVNPKNLDGDSMELVSTFLMTTKEAGVLLDGIESLIEMNGFDKVIAFVKRLNDLAAIHRSTIILSVNKKAVAQDQFKSISDEFDEIHDYQ